MFHELSEKEMNTLADAIANEFANREKMKNEMISLHQEKLLDSLANHLKTHCFLDSDTLYEGNAFMEAKDFELLFEIIIDSAEEMKRTKVDEECDFQNKVCYFSYKDVNMTFFIMWGQGTCKQVYINDEEWNEQLSFTFNDLRISQAKTKND